MFVEQPLAKSVGLLRMGNPEKFTNSYFTERTPLIGISCSWTRHSLDRHDKTPDIHTFSEENKGIFRISSIRSASNPLSTFEFERVHILIYK